jgi:pyruvate/2-oxoglutarate/acetoin dehydrogenase E1 component
MAEFGETRIRDTPLSESGFTGFGIGAAAAGMRPIVELMTVNFSLLALDQIMNTAATIRHMSGGQFGVPLVIRMATGAGKQLAAQHSHSLEGWYGHIPGLRVLAPATVEDARGMLWTALQDPDPVLIFENVMLYNMTGALDEAAGAVDIDRAAIRREGRDVSLITYGGSLWKTLEAAEALGAEGIEAEVIDLRSLRPLDDATIMASLARTRRAVVVDEGWRSGSISAEIIARINEQAFWHLDAPLGRVCAKEVPIPYPEPSRSGVDPAGSPTLSPRPARRWDGTRADERLRHALPRRRHGGRQAGRMAGQARRCRSSRRCGRCGRNPEGRHRDRDLRGRDRPVAGSRTRHDASRRRDPGGDRGWNGGNRAGAGTGTEAGATTGHRPASRAG